MTANFLTLNPSKIEFMFIGLPQQFSKIHSPSLSLPPAQPILPCSSARNLGFVSLLQPINLQDLYSSCHYHNVNSVVFVTPWTRKQQPPSPPLLSIPVSTTATHSITPFPHLNSTISNSYKMHYPEPFLKLHYTPQFLQFSTHSTGLKLNSVFNTK